MEYRQLGSSGLSVSTLTRDDELRRQRSSPTWDDRGRGASANRSVPRRGREHRRHRRRLLSGQSEEILGEALEGRGDRLVATKARIPMGSGPERRGPLPAPPACAVRGRSGACRPTTSTCTRCTSGTGRRRSRRRWRARHARRPGQGALLGVLELRRLAAAQGARHQRSARAAALRQPADLLLAAGAATPSTSCCRPRPTRASACWCGARSRAACCRASTAGRGRVAEGAQGLAPDVVVVRAAHRLPRPPVRHDRGAQGDRHGRSVVGGPGRARVAARPADRDVADHRRADGRAARGQPRRPRS